MLKWSEQQLFKHNFCMKVRRSRCKNQENGCNQLYKQDQCLLTPFKFNFNSDSLACFLGEKKKNKKKVAKAQNQRNKENKQKESQNNQKSKSPGQENLQKSQEVICSQEILQASLSAILGLTEVTTLECQWRESQEKIPETQEQPFQQANSSIWGDFSANDSLKSHGSTVDFHQNYSYYPNEAYSNSQVYYYDYFQAYNQASVELQDYQINSSSYSYQLQPTLIPFDSRTTVMIRNIPNKYTIKQLSSQIDGAFSNFYDFLYLPSDIKNQCNVGYGFINFVSTDHLLKFYELFQGRRWIRFRSEKICNLTYARLQGLDSLIEHFQNSKVLTQKQKKYRPIIKENVQIDRLIRSQQLG